MSEKIRIELCLPGDEKISGVPFADFYRITVERGDGIACSDVEAKTALSMFSIQSLVKKHKRKPAAKPDA